MEIFSAMLKNLNKIGNIFLHIPLSDKMLFCKHLAIMIRSGMTILDSLWLVEKQTRSKSFKKIIQSLIVDVDNGQFLSSGMSKYASVFGDFFINVVRVGEASGTLADNLNYLHDELKKSHELRRKVKAAMAYPLILLIASGFIGAILLFYIFPKIMPIFTSLKITLPITTRALIAAINFITNNILYIVVGLAVSVFLIWLLFKIKKIKFWYNNLLISTPFIGDVIVNINMTAFSRTFASLLKSGIKIVDATLITAETFSSPVYKKEIINLSESIRRGETISSYLLKRERFFPKIFSQMIEVGETTGHLDENLNYLAEYYEAEVDSSFKNFSTILEPLLLLIMGAVVGFIAVSIITPIYQITQNLRIG